MSTNHAENIQLTEMVRWFRQNYPDIADLLVYCPRVNTATLAKRGPYGCAELILLYPANAYSSLCVQVLSSTERNSDCHKRWRTIVEHAGSKCATVRTLFSFTEAVEEYLVNTPYE